MTLSLPEKLEAVPRGKLHAPVVAREVPDLISIGCSGRVRVEDQRVIGDNGYCGGCIRARLRNCREERNVVVAGNRIHLLLAPFLVQQVAEVEDVDLNGEALLRDERNVLPQ